MAQNILYKGVNTNRLCSPALWADCPTSESLRTMNNGKGGVEVFDDFTSGGLITSPTTEAALVGVPYSGFGSSGSTITHADYAGGAITLTEATDGEGVSMKAETHPFQISSLLGALWFEARVKVSKITDDHLNMFIGLMDTTAMSVNVPFSSANPPVLTGANLVGFFMKEADAGLVTSTYIADGVTPVDVQASVKQMAADTYVKFGMKFEPENGAKLSFWVDGVKQTSTKTVPDATGTDFPADVRLAPYFGIHLGNSSSATASIDFWRCVQLYT